MRRLGVLGWLLLAACPRLAPPDVSLRDAGPADAGPPDGGSLGVLVFSRTTGFRHDSIPDAVAALRELGSARGWEVTATEDPAAFVAALPGARVAVFALTTGDVLDDTQQATFENWVRAGGGFVGLHSASDTEYGWPFYQALVGATFAGHPAGTPQATLHIEDHAFPATAALPDPWVCQDEWYSFRANPRGTPGLHVLLNVDESTYSPGTLAMGDHPLAWWQRYQGGRSVYSALGHTRESYADPAYRAFLRASVEWAGGR